MIELHKHPSEMTENELAAVVIEICFQIHRKWGPGLLENAYEAILVNRLRENGFFVEQQKPIPLDDDGVKLDIGFRADVIVESKLILELKSVEQLHKSFFKILLTYLRLANIKLGLLINFGEHQLKDGIKRVVNGL